jgi:hypothetical protein
MRRLSRQRKEQIVMAYVLTTRGRLPTHLGELLQAMRERMGEVSEEEVRKSIAWSLQQSRRSGAAFERRLREERQRMADGGAAP